MVNENFRWQAWFRKQGNHYKKVSSGKAYQVKIEERCRRTCPPFLSAQAYMAEMPKLSYSRWGCIIRLCVSCLASRKR